MAKKHEPGELMQTEDVAAILKDDHGTFVVRHATGLAVVTSDGGHAASSLSIATLWSSAGAPETIPIAPGVPTKYQVFKLSSEILRADG